MKKVLFMLIALFTYGNVCKAQLPAASVLKAETQTAGKQKKVKTRADEAAQGDAYWFTSRSYYDERGQFSIGNGPLSSYQARFTFDGENVTISNLVDNKSYNMLSTETISGYYDADEHTITVNTPPYDGKRPVSSYTSVGTVLQYNIFELQAVLLCGDFIFDEEQGGYGLNMKGQLIFDVSDDFSVITPRSDFGCYAVNEDGRGQGFMSFYKAEPFYKVSDEGHLALTPNEIDLTPTFLYPGAEKAVDLLLQNTGNADITYNVSTTHNAISTTRSSYKLGAGKSVETSIIVAPEEEGDIEGDVIFTAANGHTATVHVKAYASEAPQYDLIVKQGDFSFETAGDAPFLVTDTITGSPVAVSTNAGDGTMSSLIASFTIPEGQTGVLSWKAFGYATQPNGCIILINGNERIRHMTGSTDDLYDVSTSVGLVAGDYTVEFQNNIGSDWYEQGFQPNPIKFYVYDLALTTEPTQEHAAQLIQESADFGSFYFDKLSTTSTATVQLLNVGTEPLTVSAIEGDGTFGGIVPTATANYLGKLDVTLTFEGTEAKAYSGNVTLKTSAGDFTVACTALNEAIPTDFSAIVKEGEFSFNTSHVYPFVLNGSRAESSTAHQDTRMGEYSWLEASFEVPAGQQGTLSWMGYNSSADYFNFMGSKSLTDGTIITIDGETSMEFAGETDASSTNFDSKALLFGPGRHSVMFLYQKKSSEPKGDDKVQVYNMKLHLDDMVSDAFAADNTDVAFTTVRYGRKSYATVNLHNEGANELSVTAIKGDGCFSGVVPTAKAFKMLPVQLIFNPTSAGSFTGDVVISTSAGDVTIHCSANADELGGKPIYNEEFEGDYSDWTFVDADGDGMSWVTATSQDCPNDLHTGYRSSECIVSVSWDIKHQQNYTPDNYAITPAISIPADGETKLLYFYSVRGNETHDVLVGQGTDLDSYTSVATVSKMYFANDPTVGWEEKEVDLSDYRGQTVNIAFRHYISSYWVRIDGVLVYTTGSVDGIDDVSLSAQGSKLYDLQGRSYSQPVKGLSIVRTTDADGRTTVKKVITK